MIYRLLYNFSLHFVKTILLLFTGLLFLTSLLSTSYSTDMEVQLVLFQWDNLLLTLPGTAVICFGIFILAARASGYPSPSVHRLLRFFILFWCLFTGLVQILFSKSVPAGDGYSVYQIAGQLAVDDTSVIHPTQSYLSYCPHQIGLVAFLEILIRIWNLLPFDLPAYHFIKIVYLLLGCVIIIFQEKTIHLLWKDETAECLYLILAGLNCPLLMYTSFVYGEIPSFAAISAGFYLLLRLMMQEHTPPLSAATPVRPKCDIPFLLTALGSVFFLMLSVMLRENSLIFIIAAMLVLLLWGLLRKRSALLLLAVLCIAASLLILPCIQKYYEYRSDSTINAGIPAISYFAMGMQESTRADGWYNGFNFITYRDTGMDTDAAVSISCDAIQERLNYFKQNPGYAAEFYLRKYLSQWADGTYACRQATLATFGGRKPFFTSLYEGKGSNYLISYCNLYQNILYLGAFCYCLLSLRRSPRQLSASQPSVEQLPAYMGLIGVFGGFLFHMLWEANARYIFPYALALLPYTAKGLSLLGGRLSNKFLPGKFPGSNKSHRPDATDTQATVKSEVH